MLLNRVRAIREAHGLTQPQLAERSGVSARTITTLETGAGYRPSFGAAEALCRYFDVPLGRLFYFDWEHEPRPRDEGRELTEVEELAPPDGEPLTAVA